MIKDRRLFKEWIKKYGTIDSTKITEEEMMAIMKEALEALEFAENTTLQ